MHNVVKNQLILITLFTLLSVSCSAKNPLQKEFGADSEYFIGLTLLKNGQENEARSKFNACIKKGSAQCVRKSYESLCSFGTVQERNQAALNYYNRYKDSDSLLLAASQLKSAGEISKVIELTKDCNLQEENNETLRLRMECLAQRGDSSLEKEVYEWFISRPISIDHYQFYRDTYKHPVFSDETEDEITAGLEQINYTPKQFILNYRIELFKRDYSYTYSLVNQLLEYFENEELTPNEQLASDIGKACLYGSTDFAKNAQLFNQLAEKYRGSPLEYYFWFYTGRLFDKAAFYYQQTKISFERAAASADSPEKKDNALWYLLISSLNFSLETITEDIKTYSRQWNNPEYFEDFFESLISGLLASGKWDTFGEIYKAIDGYATDFSVSQYAYLYGRMIQEHLAKGKAADAEIAFRRALKSGLSPYYKVLAAYQLNLSGSELESVLCAPSPLLTTKNKNAAIDLDSEKLLKGYAFFGFPELIYPCWQKLYKNGISDETSFFLANFLNRCSNGKDDYYQQALRMTSRTINERSQAMTIEQLKMLYPQNYSNYIEEYSQKYEISPSIVYAMVRSESFFDPDVQSSAGAIGLTQLMEFTGSDIARKLKVQNYELTDPEVNIQFGSFYLSELIHRCEGSMLLGFFSYNAGITRVRRWSQSTMIQFGKKEKMPIDLFLETVPYAETREYGRKLAGAAVMYEWLYSENSDINFIGIIEKMIK